MLKRGAFLMLVLTVPALASPVAAEETLTPATVKAFDQYVQAAERRTSPGFLAVDALDEKRRGTAYAALRAGELLIDRVSVRDGGKEIDVPAGMVHHWRGTAFLKGARLDEVLALLQDYNRHQAVYQKNIARSTLRSRSGDRFDFHLRFVMTKVITVVVDSEHRAQFTREGPDRASSRIYSTKINQVDDAGEADERQLPEGRDGGYLWRLNSYWKLLERDGGVYLQCESISLTTTVPWWASFVRPFITGIPRETLAYTIEATRAALGKRPA